MVFSYRSIFIIPFFLFAAAFTKAQEKISLQVRSFSSLRQGDHFELTVNIVNTGDSEITGQVQLQLLDATTNESVDGWFQNVFPNQYFTVGARSNETVKFPLEVPYQFTSMLVWKIITAARSRQLEKHGTIPVLSNQFFHVETIPFSVKTSSKEIKIKNLASSGNNETELNKSLSVAVYNNTLWPLLKELPLLASHVNQPLDYFDRLSAYVYAKALHEKFPWLRNTIDSSSTLDKNPLINLTPWTVYGNQKTSNKLIPVFFDSSNLEKEYEKSLHEFVSVQFPDGSFPWMKGGAGDKNASAYIFDLIRKWYQAGLIKKHDTTFRNVERKLQHFLKGITTSAKNFSPLNDSCFSLLNPSSSTTTALPAIHLIIGSVTAESVNDSTTSAGYFVKTINGSFVKPEMANIKLELSSAPTIPLKGYAEWSYFSDETKHLPTPAIKINKTVFVQKIINGKTGWQLLRENTVLHEGDIVKTVLTIDAEKNINWIMMKDQYPSTFEQNTPGMFVKRGTLNYYEKKLPGQRSYFFPVLPKGNHSFSYTITVMHAGKFSGGVFTAGPAFDQENFIYRKDPAINVE
jgi:hypothetical protein